MPVTTRYQHYLSQVKECTRRFEETITNPCVLNLIIENLSEQDMIAMKQISKDSQFNDVIDYKLKKIKKYRQKVQKIVKKIGNYLIHIESLYLNKEKINVMNKMFQFLCINKWFIKEYQQFAKVTHDKLFELITSPKEIRHLEESEKLNVNNNCIKYLIKLYDLKPPTNYYNSKLDIIQYGMVDIDGKLIIMNK